MQCNVLGEEEKIDVLYGLAEPEVVRRVRQHVSSCPACRAEMAALDDTRGALRQWSLPEAPHRPAAGARPTWALPMAAALLLAVGGALALRGSELRFEDGAFSFRLGPAADHSLRRLLAEQDARHHQEMAQLRASMPQPAATAAAPSRADIRAWIRESEARQGHQLHSRFEEFKERSDSARRLDMARVSAGLSYLDGKNGQHVARTSELMNYMLQASYKK